MRHPGVGGALALLALTGAEPLWAATLVISVQTPTVVRSRAPCYRATPRYPPRRPAPVHAVMDQVSRASLRICWLSRSAPVVAFPNSDSVSHQIYSFSAAKRFPAAPVPRQAVTAVQFDQTGVITLGCNSPRRHARVSAGHRCAVLRPHGCPGRLSVNVPRGRYQVSIWQPATARE